MATHLKPFSVEWQFPVEPWPPSGEDWHPESLSIVEPCGIQCQERGSTNQVPFKTKQPQTLFSPEDTELGATCRLGWHSTTPSLVAVLGLVNLIELESQQELWLVFLHDEQKQKQNHWLKKCAFLGAVLMNVLCPLMKAAEWSLFLLVTVVSVGYLEPSCHWCLCDLHWGSHSSFKQSLLPLGDWEAWQEQALPSGLFWKGSFLKETGQILRAGLLWLVGEVNTLGSYFTREQTLL